MIEKVVELPDGSGFATMSMPLPDTHWLYAPRAEGWDNERDCASDLPHPVIDNSQREAVKVALRWAIRGATMNGTVMDFDPDALMLNAAYALCGPANGNAVAGESPDARDAKRLDWLETQVVEVRTPARYGSRKNFIVGPDEDDTPSNLRKRVDAAMGSPTDE